MGEFRFPYNIAELSELVAEHWGPEAVNFISLLTDRDRALEDHVSASETIFSYAGGLSSGIPSPPTLLRFGGSLSEVAVALGTAGSTNTVIDVLRDGSVVATVTVPATDATYTVAITPVPFTAGQSLALEVTTAGTGAADMTAAARF